MPSDPLVRLWRRELTALLAEILPWQGAGSRPDYHGGRVGSPRVGWQGLFPYTGS